LKNCNRKSPESKGKVGTTKREKIKSASREKKKKRESQTVETTRRERSQRGGRGAGEMLG